MVKIYIKKEGENFKVFEGDNFIGLAEKKNYPKDQKYGIIWKLPKNSLNREWVSAGKMADGLELEAHIEKSVSINNVDNFNIFNKIYQDMDPDDQKILDNLKEKYIKKAKKLELERQIRELQEKLDEME